MNDNYGLVYPDLKDYYDVNVTNSNFSKLADSIDALKKSGVKKEVVIAAYNSQNKYKEVADFVCNKNDCKSVIANAIESCCEGGEILFLDGDYYFESTLEVNKAVRILGYGVKTRFNVANTFTGYCMLNIKADNVTIKDISFFDNPDYNMYLHYICLGCLNVTICGCDFNMNIKHSADSISAIYIESYKCRLLVMGCYFRRYDDESWFIYGKKSIIVGVCIGNYSENIENDSELKIKIYTSNTDSASRIKTGAQNTYIFANTGGVYNG
ncbi:MAG: hypothetical protein ACI4VF_03180 [Lachnospirales bacterium]